VELQPTPFLDPDVDNVDEEDSAEDEDDFNEAEDLFEEEEEEGEIITNSPKQLSNCSFEPGSKFKNVSSILVDGYSFCYRCHQSNKKNTTTWYR
jgi:hypothetical protein